MTLLRRGSGPPHKCSPPFEGVQGDVWRCDDCRQRWTCTDGDRVWEFELEPPEPFHESASWEPRFWPWPR